MKNTLLLAIVMVAALSSSILAVGFLGTPTAEIGEGNWIIGYDYSYSSQDTERTAGWLVDLAFPFEGPLNMQLKDFKLHRHYAVIGYGLLEDLDVYIKLGVSDLEVFKQDFDAPPASWKIDFDNDFAWGWGTRYTIAKQDNISWGAALQMNWLDTESTRADAFGNWKFSFDSYDLLISAGPTFDMGGWNIYGGPFYYYLNGDYELNIVDAGGLWYSERADIRADRNWGGFIGSTVDLGHNLNWTIEYSTTGKGWGLGTGIAWSF